MRKHNASLQWNTASAPRFSFAVLEQRGNELASPSTYAQTFYYTRFAGISPLYAKYLTVRLARMRTHEWPGPTASKMSK